MVRRRATFTLFPYTTLFRSEPVPAAVGVVAPALRGVDDHEPAALGHVVRSEEHTSELQSLRHLVCRLLLEKKKHIQIIVRDKRWSNEMAIHMHFLSGSKLQC